jgi:hypothetical protein
MNRRPIWQHFNIFYEDFEYRLHTELQSQRPLFFDIAIIEVYEPLGRHLGSIHANTFVHLNRKMAKR